MSSFQDTPVEFTTRLPFGQAEALRRLAYERRASRNSLLVEAVRRLLSEADETATVETARLASERS